MGEFHFLKMIKYLMDSNIWRREGDSNPRSILRRKTVFETAAFNRSAISPELRQKYKINWYLP